MNLLIWKLKIQNNCWYKIMKLIELKGPCTLLLISKLCYWWKIFCSMCKRDLIITRNSMVEYTVELKQHFISQITALVTSLPYLYRGEQVGKVPPKATRINVLGCLISSFLRFSIFTYGKKDWQTEDNSSFQFMLKAYSPAL